MAATEARADHIDFIQDDSNTAKGINNATLTLFTSGAAVTDTQTGDPAEILH